MQKVQNLGNERSQNIKSFTKNQVCAIVHIQARERIEFKTRFTQIYNAMYVDAMLVSL